MMPVDCSCHGCSSCPLARCDLPGAVFGSTNSLVSKNATCVGSPYQLDFQEESFLRQLRLKLRPQFRNRVRPPLRGGGPPPLASNHPTTAKYITTIMRQEINIIVSLKTKLWLNQNNIIMSKFVQIILRILVYS